MNEVLYRDLIVRWIPYNDRPIVQQKDLWLLSYRRVKNNSRYRLLLSDIYLHGGICDKRYCICKYFEDKDKLDCFDRCFRILL